MIKFFRKIRQNLLSQGKTGKYFKYAIGEIFLVVIGILIALQINNLNDQRKARAVTHLYYKQLLEDFEIDKNYIEETSSVIDSNLVRYEAYEAIYDKKDLTLPEALEGLGIGFSVIKNIDFPSNTISTLQNTGDIKLIPSQIRNKLIDLQKRKDKLVKSSGLNNTAILEFFNSARIISGGRSFAQRIQDQAELIKYYPDEQEQIKILRTLEAAFQLKNDTERGELYRLEKIKKQIDEITKLINAELDK